MGRGRRRRSAETLVGAAGEDGPKEVAEAEEEVVEGKGFFACYLLCSLSPRHKGHTYIGFTVNPRRRIRQHNGEITSGAWRTKRKRPWEMILCIYGFPTNVNALQFEWAWQHPRESLAVRKAAESFKSLSGIANKIKIAYTMLTLPSWENFNLTVNFFSTKYMNHAVGCPRLPKTMRVNVRVMDELPCYIDGQTLDDDDGLDNNEVCEDEDGTLSESMNAPLNQSVGDNDSKERAAYEDPNGQQEYGGSRYPIYSFIQSPVRTCNGYSWQMESDNTIQQANLIDSCLATPTKLNSHDSVDQSSHSDATSLIEPSTPMTSGADNNVRKRNKCYSPDGDVINLLTPSSCIIHSEDTQAPVCRRIIDLTKSPEIIQL